MKRALGLCLLLAVGLARAADVGAPAPDFRLEGRTQPVSLSAARGHYVYLDFWASWCAPCRRSFPWMARLQQRFGAAGLKVVAVNVDAVRADALGFLAEHPAQFDVAFDPAGTTARAYAIKGMPSSVLIGPAGQIIAQHAGFNDDTAAAIETQLTELLSPKAHP